MTLIKYLTCLRTNLNMHVIDITIIISLSVCIHHTHTLFIRHCLIYRDCEIILALEGEKQITVKLHPYHTFAMSMLIGALEYCYTQQVLHSAHCYIHTGVYCPHTDAYCSTKHIYCYTYTQHTAYLQSFAVAECSLPPLIVPNAANTNCHCHWDLGSILILVVSAVASIVSVSIGNKPNDEICLCVL